MVLIEKKNYIYIQNKFLCYLNTKHSYIADGIKHFHHDLKKRVFSTQQNPLWDKEFDDILPTLDLDDWNDILLKKGSKLTNPEKGEVFFLTHSGNRIDDLRSIFEAYKRKNKTGSFFIQKRKFSTNNLVNQQSLDKNILKQQEFFELLQNQLKKMPNKYGVALFEDLNKKWGCLIDPLRKNENFEKLQKEIEQKIAELNKESHKKLPKQKSWSFSKKDHIVVREYFKKVGKNYDPNKILISAISESYIYFSRLDSEPQTFFIFNLFRQFNDIYENLEQKKNLSFKKEWFSEKEQFNIGEFLLKKLLDLNIVKRIKKINKYKKNEFFICLENDSYLHKTGFRNVEHIPMVCTPRDWENQKILGLDNVRDISDSISPTNGGLLLSDFQTAFLYEPIKQEMVDSKVIYGSNTMMSQFSDFALLNINYIQRTPFLVKENELKKIIKNLDVFLKQKLNLHFYVYESLDAFVNSEVRSESVPESVHYQILELAYKNQKVRLKNAITELFLSIVFFGKNLYFVTFADFRGRIYRKGWPLNPQGSIISKLLLSVSDCSVMQKDRKTIRLDAIASGFSIYGMLSGSVKLLSQTNIIKSGVKYNDFYLYVLNYLEKRMPFLDNLKKYNGEKLITRELLKQILIPMMYNQSIPGVRATLLKENEIYLLENVLKARFPQQKNVLFFFASLLRKEIDNCFPEIGKIKSILEFGIETTFEKESISLITYNQNNLIKSKMFYPKLESQQILINYLEDQVSAYIKKPLEPRSLSMLKSKVAIPANFIHSLDAVIMLLTVNELRLKKIPVSTTHDCFLVHDCFIEDTQHAYITAVKKVIKSDYLLDFIVSNEVKFVLDKTSKIHRDIKAMKKNCLKVLDQADFVKDPLKLEKFSFDV